MDAHSKENDPINFSSLVLGLSSAALSYMGHLPGREFSPHECNLPLAKQNIDIIAMLQEKTKGNLSASEEELISQILTDLRVKFVDFTKKID